MNRSSSWPMHARSVWKGPNLSKAFIIWNIWQIFQQIYPHFSSQIIQVKYLSCDATICCADFCERQNLQALILHSIDDSVDGALCNRITEHWTWFMSSFYLGCFPKDTIAPPSLPVMFVEKSRINPLPDIPERTFGIEDPPEERKVISWYRTVCQPIKMLLIGMVWLW